MASPTAPSSSGFSPEKTPQGLSQPGTTQAWLIHPSVPLDLVPAATELIAEAGVAGVTLEATGERAGYSRGVVNYHFGTSAGLVGEAIAEVATQFVAAVGPDERDATGVDALVATVERFIARLETAGSTDRAFLALWAISLVDEGVRRRMVVAEMGLRRSIEAVFERALARGEIDAAVDAETRASLFLAQLYGLGVTHLTSPGATELRASVIQLEVSLRRSFTGP